MDKDGLSFIELLQVAFIVLKLCRIINWSWLIVLSPIFICIILAIILIILSIIGGK